MWLRLRSDSSGMENGRSAGRHGLDRSVAPARACLVQSRAGNACRRTVPPTTTAPGGRCTGSCRRISDTAEKRRNPLKTGRIYEKVAMDTRRDPGRAPNPRRSADSQGQDSGPFRGFSMWLSLCASVGMLARRVIRSVRCAVIDGLALARPGSRHVTATVGRGELWS